MAITFGNSNSNSASSGTTITVSLTTVADDDYLEARAAASDNTVISVVLDPGGADEQALSLAVQEQSFGNPGVDGTSADIFYLTGSNMPPAGTYDIEFTFEGTIDTAAAWVRALQGAADQAPEATQSSTAQTVSSESHSITTVTDGALVIDSIAVSQPNNDLDSDTGQTNDFRDLVNARAKGMSYKEVATAGSTSMGWTWSQNAGDVVHVSAAIAPVAVGLDNGRMADMAFARGRMPFGPGSLPAPDGTID